MKMQITFKSGAQITVDVEKFTTTTNSITDRLTGLRWETPADATASIAYLADLDDITAIVRLD